MIPYFEQPKLALGPITIYTFGVLVAATAIVGLSMAVKRTKRLGYHPQFLNDALFFTIVVGFVLSHIFDTITYYPERVLSNPLILLQVWNGISSLGGILGGIFSFWLYFRWKAPKSERPYFWQYLDIIAFCFPFCFIFGRLGCFLAHDHPGSITHFPLAISLATPQAQAYITYIYEQAGLASILPAPTELSTMGFHDLGFYELLYLTFLIIPIFWLLDRLNPKRPAGFYLAMMGLIYSPIRFALDFLRVADATYFGLTPGQYACIVFFAVGLFALWKMRTAKA